MVNDLNYSWRPMFRGKNRMLSICSPPFEFDQNRPSQNSQGKKFWEIGLSVNHDSRLEFVWIWQGYVKIFKSTCLNIHIKHFTFSYLVRKLFLSKGFLVKRGLLIAAQDMHSFDLKTELYKIHMLIKSHAWMAWEQ